ncbi:MAG TPA: hypothetical protein VGN18_10020 [Jatrophihabitans sp.]|jgi:hypothetical protein|nr:hypothetical protein [Jatrophihabitans sp.]
MGDVLLTLAIIAAAAWLTVALYLGYEVETEALEHRPRRSPAPGRRTFRA